jgi:hypothetical protein
MQHFARWQLSLTQGKVAILGAEFKPAVPFGSDRLKAMARRRREVFRGRMLMRRNCGNS